MSVESSSSSDDDFFSLISSECSADDTFLAPSTSESIYQSKSDLLLKGRQNGDGPMSVPCGPTSDDIESSQIFDGYESNYKMDHIKGFNECVQFFSALSTKNKTNKPFIVGINNRLCACSKEKFHNVQSMNKSTCTQTIIKVDVQVQTTAVKDFSFQNSIKGEVTKVHNPCEDYSRNVTNNYGQSLNFLSASATSVASLLNDKGNSKFTCKSTAKSTESGLAATKASTEAISLVIKAIEKQYANLLDQGELTIKLSTICIINKAIVQNSNNSKGSYKFIFPKLPIVNKSYIAHISDSSRNSSTSDESLPENSQIFVATPFTLTSVMTEESHPIPSVPSTSSTQLNGSNINLNFQDNTQTIEQSRYGVAERNVEYSKILQNTFFRTSTPLMGVEFRRKCISNMNIFPSSSFVKSTSFKELRTNPSVHTSLSKSLDYRQKASNVNNKFSDRRIFLSLYNLTCPLILGCKELNSQSHNPTNIFFNNSKSYASLKETDIDSGKEMTSPIYKETNLDGCPHNFKGGYFKAKSLSNISKAKKESALMVCGDIDENILNITPNLTPLSVSTNLLYVRLRENAKSPAQIKVAKSITKLNIPEWMNSIEFSEKKSVNCHFTSPQIEHEFRSPNNNRTLQSRIKRYKNLFSQIRHTDNVPSLNFSLPSAKLQNSENKLKPIKVSKARQALDLSKKPITQSLNTYDISAGMVALSKEFLSHLNYKNEDFRSCVTMSTKDVSPCSKLQCSKKIKASVLCKNCFEVYCSIKCLKEDKKVHLDKCDSIVLKKKLSFLLDSINKTQIIILAQIFELGFQHLGKGFILWNVENSTVNNEIQFRLPRYVLVTEASEIDITSKLKEIMNQDFLFVITSKSSINNAFIISSKCYRRQFTGENICDLSPLKTYKRSNLNHIIREEIVNKIISLLRNFNVDLQEKYPTTYYKLMEYASTGSWFVQQVISVCDPGSGSFLKLIIEPDQMPEHIKILFYII